jgi:hypothetical protein
MSFPLNARTITPFRSAGKPVFIAGAAQEEALARLEYLHERGGGWALLAGPQGIGKSALFSEIGRRARRRGEDLFTRHWNSSDCGVVRAVLADAWSFGLAADCPDADLRRRLDEHVRGLAALQRLSWVLIDDVDELTTQMQRDVRWLAGLAARIDARLTIAVACRQEIVEAQDADLRFTLWAWNLDETSRFVAECCRAACVESKFSREGVAALVERSGGIPGQLTKLAEWSWLAAEAEAEPEITAELVHAVADELSPAPSPRRQNYEMSAAYAAW